MGQSQQIVANPVFGVFGLMLGVVSLILAIYSTDRARKYTRLAFGTTKIDLVSDYVAKIPDVQITYNGKGIRALSVSRILFWNDGNEIINATDVALVDPVCIESPEGVEIFTARLSGVTSERNRIRLETSGRTITVGFDFLEPGDGAAVEVTHSGKSVSIAGSIKGAGQPKRKPWEADDAQRVVSPMESFGGLLADASMVLVLIFILSQNPANMWAALGGFLVAITMTAVWLRIATRKSPLKRIRHAMSFE